MTPSDGSRECLDCPHGGLVEEGLAHVRCANCRKDHRMDKAADAQWDRRDRDRREALERRRLLGYAASPDPLVRPRDRTPAWDQYGREIVELPRLTQHQGRALLAALDRLDEATAAVRAALDPRG